MRLFRKAQSLLPIKPREYTFIDSFPAMDKRKKILVIEDDRDVATLLTLRLERKGFEVVVASDGETGLEKVRSEMPGLVILDLMLPGLQGEEVCKSIREDEDEKIAALPILVLTGKSSDADRIICRVIGANSYLTKPYDVDQLLEEITYRLSAVS